MWTLLHTLLLLLGFVRLTPAAEDQRNPPLSSQNRWIKEMRSASSLDEVLRLTNYADWKLWRCRLKLKLKNLDSSPLMEDRAPSHRSTRYASPTYSLEILNAIKDEWEKTQCMPRETCVDVATEMGSPTDIFFKPPCVSVFRCNGCCNKEGVACRNTSTTYVNKTLFSVTPFKTSPEPVLVKVANHTECKCLEPPMIRRHTATRTRNWCSLAGQPDVSHRLCDNGLIWDCTEDRCVPYPSQKPVVSTNVQRAHCEIDVNRCECIPRDQRPSQPPRN
ncbi:vascular endothelial growth factor D [Alosa pseudoharengus]|uniref:vascular endothelial growth factor D n=1 Tax=Alosa pseudoharengus TaxID=34774 RepID=UPI003F8ACEA8